jgi:hypothetical protein
MSLRSATNSGVGACGSSGAAKHSLKLARPARRQSRATAPRPLRIERVEHQRIRPGSSVQSPVRALAAADVAGGRFGLALTLMSSNRRVTQQCQGICRDKLHREVQCG